MNKATARVIYRPTATGEECLGVVVDPAEIATLTSDGDAMPVGAYMRDENGFSDGAQFGFFDRITKEPVIARVFMRAEWETKQDAVDAFVLSAPAEVRAKIVAEDWKTEAEKKQQRADERAVAEAKRLADLEAAEAAKP